jgi:hypothetical protein
MMRSTSTSLHDQVRAKSLATMETLRGPTTSIREPPIPLIYRDTDDSKVHRAAARAKTIKKVAGRIVR